MCATEPSERRLRRRERGRAGIGTDREVEELFREEIDERRVLSREL